jgi:hypothetical protein
MSRRKLTQVQLFTLIFDEFASRLGDSFPTLDLLRAADRLAKLIDNDFNVRRLDRVVARSNYYTHDLTWAFSQRMWQIACREQKADLIDDQRLREDPRAMLALNEYLDSW